ncbi:MAG TPA: hypothetical protein GX396_10400 [Tissierellia bacterium]|jgi:uncharacterized membrane protein YczE|nr:hypothetical protein [Tissierellia bacterium]
MQNYLKRMWKLSIGLILYSFGLLFNIHANIGLAPWEAFSIGIYNVTGISFGKVSVITGILILIAVALYFREKIGVGTILNTIFIGLLVDLWEILNIIPYMNTFASGLVMLFLGQVLVSLATYFYVSAGLGSGPRDTLMIALGKKFSNVPIGVIRGLIEGTVLLIGWILGAKVGLGTVVYVFGISFILQTTFNLLNFDVKSVEHESIFDTINALKELYAKSEA